MNLFEADPTKAQENLEEYRRAAMEACPEPLRRYLAAVDEARERAMRAMASKSQHSARLHELEKSLDGIADGKEWEKRQAEIGETRYLLREEEVRCSLVKDDCRRVEQEYHDAVVAYRIREVPEAHREEALALLSEEQNELQAISTEPPTDGGHVGSVAGRFFGIELRLQDAEKRGDAEAVARLLPLREAAKAELAQVEAAMTRKGERSAEIKEIYDARLQSLTDRDPAS